MEVMNNTPFLAFTRIALNNWHYISRKVLSLNREINFFTGHSGSGKSTVIDAMQLVLYANTDGRGFFNKAAADDSDRSLIEYLRGMVNIGENNEFSYLRNQNFSSTIVLEMQLTGTENFQCIGIVFDVNTASNEVSRRFFWHKGSLWENEYRIDGATYNLTQHGFARDMNFELIREQPDELRYRLADNEESRRRYPFPFRLEIGYRIQGKQIEVLWEVKNTGDKELHFQIGAHPAFYFPAFDMISEGGGSQIPANPVSRNNIIVISQTDPEHEYPLRLTDGLLPLDTHTFDRDALILENNQVEKVTLYNKEKQPYLSLRFTTPVVGLWSPPAKNAPFICIEPWYGRCDRAHYDGEYKDKDWMQHLQPAAVFKGGYVIQIEE